MINTQGGRLPVLLVVSFVAVFSTALGDEARCKLHGKFVPCPEDLGSLTNEAPAPSTTKKTKGIEWNLADMWNHKKSTTPSPASFYAPPPTPSPTPVPTPAPAPVVTVGTEGDTNQGKKNIGKIVGASVGVASALAAAGAGIGIAIAQEQKNKKEPAPAPPPGVAGAPTIAAKAEVNEPAGSKSKSSGGSMDGMKPGHGSLKSLKGEFWESSGDFTWLIVLGLSLLLFCCVCAGIYAACRGGKKKPKKPVPRSMGGMPPAVSVPSQQEQAPLLQQRGGLGGSFPPPAPQGQSRYGQTNTNMDAMPTTTMYNGPAQAGFGGYYPSTAGAGAPNPVSPLALETTPALAPPPPPPKPPHYQSPPNSFGYGGYGQQPGTYFGTGTLAGAAGMQGMQTNAPRGPPSFPKAAPPGRPDLQTMPPQARPQPPSQGWGYGGLPPPAAAGYAPVGAQPGGYSNTQMMETMPALPKQTPFGFR